jgi:hypothetical protein
MMNGWPSVIQNKTGLFLVAAIFFAGSPHPVLSLAGQVNSPPLYVGSNTCEPCHKEEYASFIQFAKKSKSFQSIERLEKGLSPEDLKKCYSCHTTGYGRPGGFISVEETPELKNAGCEVCHGPGGIHVITGDTDAIKRQLTREDCEACHTSERVRAFRYKPLIHGGGH